MNSPDVPRAFRSLIEQEVLELEALSELGPQRGAIPKNSWLEIG